MDQRQRLGGGCGGGDQAERHLGAAEAQERQKQEGGGDGSGEKGALEEDGGGENGSAAARVARGVADDETIETGEEDEQQHDTVGDRECERAELGRIPEGATGEHDEEEIGAETRSVAGGGPERVSTDALHSTPPAGRRWDRDVTRATPDTVRPGTSRPRRREPLRGRAIF